METNGMEKYNKINLSGFQNSLMENVDNFWTEGSSKKELKEFNSASTDAFDLRTKHKNPFYSSTDNETNESDDETNTPKIENYHKMGQKTFGGEVTTKKPIYLQLMLDGKVPVKKLMDIEMPQELKDELRDWEAKFPNLRVDGKCADAGHPTRDMRMLRRQIARCIAEEHLWPELRSVLSTKKVHEGEQQQQKTLRKSKSPKKVGTNSAAAVGGGAVKLPPINRKF